MRGKTHSLTGALVTSSIAAIAFKDYSIIPIMVGGVSALMPDLDHEYSYATNKIVKNFTRTKTMRSFKDSLVFRRIVSLFTFVFWGAVALRFGNIALALLGLWFGMYPFTKHRTISHSLTAVLIIGILLYFGQPKIMILIYFLIGYLVHILEDMLTYQGVPLLYPFNKKRQSIPLMATGSPLEYVVIGLSIVMFIFSRV